MDIRMRSGEAMVNGEWIKMSLSPMEVGVGSVYQTLRGEWKTVVHYYGEVEINGEPMFGYETRKATAEEIAIATAPVDKVAESAFWNDFFDNVDR